VIPIVSAIFLLNIMKLTCSRRSSRVAVSLNPLVWGCCREPRPRAADRALSYGAGTE
jgi:hypothetical protein